MKAAVLAGAPPPSSVPQLLPILANDIPWSAGGLMRCFDLVTEEGTLNNATFPAAVGRGPIGPAWLTGSLTAECLSQMLDRDLELGKNVQATCCGTWDTAVIAGLDERGEQPTPFDLPPGRARHPSTNGQHTDGISKHGATSGQHASGNGKHADAFCTVSGRVQYCTMT